MGRFSVERIQCAECGEMFNLPACEARGRRKATKSGNLFCSHVCSASYGNRVKRDLALDDHTCAYCGRTRHVVLSHDNTGRDLDGNKVFLCTKGCRSGMAGSVRKQERRRWVADTLAAGHMECTRCGEDKPLEKFPKRTGTAARGIMPYWRVCTRCKSASERKKSTRMDPVEAPRPVPFPNGEIPSIDNWDRTPVPGPGDDHRVLGTVQEGNYKWHCRVCGLAHTAYDDARDCCSRGGYYPPEKIRLMPWRRDGKSGEQACAQATEAGA